MRPPFPDDICIRRACGSLGPYAVQVSQQQRAPSGLTPVRVLGALGGMGRGSFSPALQVQTFS